MYQQALDKVSSQLLIKDRYDNFIGGKRVAPVVLLGEIAGCPFYIGAAHFDLVRGTQLVIDVVPGRGSGFSAEAPEGVRFLTRSRVFTEGELAELDVAGAPTRAA